VLGLGLWLVLELRPVFIVRASIRVIIDWRVSP